MRKIFPITFLVILLLGSFSFTSAQERTIEVNFFYSQTCPHCQAEKEFLKNLQGEYPQVEIKQYEVIYDQDNQKILKDFYERYKVPESDQGWVPVTFTPEKYFIGFNDDIGNQIKNCLVECINGNGGTVKQQIQLPIVGKIDVSKVSLPLLTMILGTLDGFNPCAMWVLVILVSLLLGLKSRKKIALVGGTFIFAEGFLYFLFMTAWLNAFLAMKYVFWIRILIGVFGIVFGILRIKDFVLWKPGVCKVVDHSKSQEKLLERMKNVLKPAAVPTTILGVIALAFSVNLVEFFCSAGFPTLYTQILALQDVGRLQYYLYLIFYNFFYMLDDFIVFGFAFFTLNRFGFSDKYNRYSTLVAGLLILILGLLLIFRPNLLMFV